MDHTVFVANACNQQSKLVVLTPCSRDTFTYIQLTSRGCAELQFTRDAVTRHNVAFAPVGGQSDTALQRCPVRRCVCTVAITYKK
eukprot:1007526-Prymnesium_polylepis.1